MQNIEDKTEEEWLTEFKELTGGISGFAMWHRNKTFVLPEYNAYGLIKVPGGYKVHTMRMLGKKIVKHSYTEVEPKNFALNKMLSKIRADLNEDS